MGEWIIEPATGHVTSSGRVIGSVDIRGYRVLTVNRGPKRSPTTIYEHRLVWEAHRGSIPAGMTVDHLNGVKTDNRLINLEIVTRSENGRRAARKYWSRTPRQGVQWDT